MNLTNHKLIMDYLTEIIKEKKDIENYKLPSERILANKFNISRKPIRQAYQKLADRGLVNAIHGKGYYINNSTASNANLLLSFKRKSKLSLIIPSVETRFSQEITGGINSFCAKNDLDFSIHISNNDPEKELELLHMLPHLDTNGIILFPTDTSNISNKTLKNLLPNRYPLTVIDRKLSSVKCCTVSTNHYTSMVEATRFLHQKGYTKITYAAVSSPGVSSLEERMQGFRHGLFKYYQVLESRSFLELPTEKSQQKAACVNFLKKYPDTEVIIICCTHASLVVDAAQELNISIPDSLKLMFYDNELTPALRRTLNPYLINQEPVALGYQAAQLCYDQMHGNMQVSSKLLSTNIQDPDIYTT